MRDTAVDWGSAVGPGEAVKVGGDTQDLPYPELVDPEPEVLGVADELPEEVTLPGIAHGFREPLPLHVFLTLRADGTSPTRAILSAFESLRSDATSVEANLSIARVLLRKAVALPNRFADGDESVHASIMRDRAARHIQIALAGDPDLPEAHALMAVVLEELAETEASAREWERCRALGQDSVEMTACCAVALARNGQPSAALDLLSSLSEERQRSVEATLARAEILRDLGRSSEAARLFEAAASRPAPIVLRNRAKNGLGLALWRLEHKDAALEAFTRAVEDDPSAVESAWNRGVALERLGAEGQARDLMKSTALLAPWDEELEAGEKPPRADSDLGPTPPQSAAPDGERQLTGALCVLALEDVLDFLSSRRMDGFLKVTSGDNEGVLCMWKGELVGAVSPTARPVSAILSNDAEPQTSSPVLERALEGCRLLGDRRYEAETLRTAVGEQIRTALHEMLRWRSGSFAFARSAPGDIPETAEHLALDTRFMLMDIMREMDEAAAGR